MTPELQAYIEDNLAPADGNGCRLWRGYIKKGVGVVRLKDVYYGLVHKLTFGPHRGNLANLCGNKHCATPEHWRAREQGLAEYIQANLAPPNADGCRLWTKGRGAQGHGTVYYEGKTYQLNRLIRPDISSKRAHPACGNKHCGTPGHWEEAPFKFKGREKENDREREYGLPIGSLDSFLAPGCHMCGCKDRLVVDHDHPRDKVRGVLCQKHNQGIGKLGDTETGLERAAAYLRSNGIVLIDSLPQTEPYNKSSRAYYKELSWRRRTFANKPVVDELYHKGNKSCHCCNKPLQFKGSGGAHVDHEDLPDGSKRVRGILCSSCNTGLGKLGDNLEGVERALAYLRGELNPRKDHTNGAILS